MRWVPTLPPLAPLLLRGVLALLVLLPALWHPAPAAAGLVSPPRHVGSAVACLNGADSFAAAQFADTIFNIAPPTENVPAIQQVTDGVPGSTMLAPLGTNGGTVSGRALGGIGAVYGLAYDDGAASGARRLFAAAYTKRLSSFGQGGPGALYAYDLGAGDWSPDPVITVANAGWDRPALTPPDIYDRAAIPHVGRSGLDDRGAGDGRGSLPPAAAAAPAAAPPPLPRRHPPNEVSTLSALPGGLGARGGQKWMEGAYICRPGEAPFPASCCGPSKSRVARKLHVFCMFFASCV